MERVLLFDCDGTIVDSLDVAVRSYNLLAPQYKLSKMKKNEFVRLYDHNIYESLVKIGLPYENVKQFNLELRELFLQNGYSPKLFPGIKRVINKLAESNKVIVITSNITTTVQDFLKKAGINIHEVIGSDKETSKVKKILQVKERFPTNETYYIGDTKGDVIEGQKADVKTIGVTWGYHDKKTIESAEPDYVVEKADELLKILN